MTIDTSKLRSNLGGPKYSFGARFDGIPLDHPALSARRKLVDKDDHQPEYRLLPSSIGESTSVKFNPPRLSTAGEFNKVIVGPGRYDPKAVEKIQTHLMIRPQQRPQTISQTPGPGEYKPEDVLRYLHPGFSKSIGGVIPVSQQSTARDNPGPGSYNPAFARRTIGPKMMARTMSQIKVEDKKPLMSGKYNSMSQIKPKIERPTFSKASRGEPPAKLITPGPDAYQDIEADWITNRSNTAFDKESCKFGMKTGKFYQTNKNPGPGSYEYYYPFYNGLYYSFGKGPRGDQGNICYTDKYYDLNDIYKKPGISFPCDLKESEFKKSKYPGPGTYNIPDTVGIIPEYLLNGRKVD